MNTDDTNTTEAVGSPLGRGVRPLLWARKDQVLQALRMPSMVVCCDEKETRGRHDFQPIYDQAALDAADREWSGKLEAADAEVARLTVDVARMRDALLSIRKHCEPQPSALAAAIVATCDNGLGQPLTMAKPLRPNDRAKRGA